MYVGCMYAYSTVCTCTCTCMQKDLRDNVYSDKLFEIISQETTIWISFDERLYTTEEVGHDQE